ncbi:MAG: septal ring lytic transglycosylase RlpA family protein [Janthinobacterium lividum]
MTFSRTASKSLGFIFCILSLLTGTLSAATARHRYVNKHTVSTTRVIAAGITVLRGRASWYGIQFQGSRTTSGERFDRFKYTCAHRTLPFGTRLRVTNVKTHKSVVVRVADRGPFRHQRILDLAEIAARPLDIVEQGAATVLAEVVDAGTPLGPTSAPNNLLALVAADPDPTAAHATYPAPVAETPILVAATPAAVSLPSVVAAVPQPAPHLVLQTVAFADPQQAQAMMARILTLDENLPVTLTTEVLDGRELNYVLIGQLDNWLATETVRRKLLLWGIVSLVRQLPAEQQPAGILAVATAPAIATAALQ